MKIKKLLKKIFNLLKNKKYKEALPTLNILAKKNNIFALNSLGNLYQVGYGVKKDYKKLIFYNRSKELGNPNAYAYLAIMYQYGLGMDIDYKKAFVFHKYAANYNISNSQSNIGFMYLKGLGVVKDFKEAIRWIKLAAINGNSIAQRNLGLMYQNGHGTSKNYIEAKKWYVLSANQGDKIAIDSLEIINTLIRENPKATDNNISSLKILEGFSDFRTMTVKRGKKIFHTYAAIKEDQIESNWITEGKVVIDNEICSSNSTYNVKTNAGILLLECPSGYSATGKVIPLGISKGSRGEGIDSLGNNFQFNLHSKIKGKAKKEDMIVFLKNKKILLKLLV